MEKTFKKTIEVECTIKLPFYGQQHGENLAILENGKMIRVYKNLILISEEADSHTISNVDNGKYTPTTIIEFVLSYQHALNNIQVEFMNLKLQSENEFIKNVSIASGEM